jgi:hypothetical protein
MKFAVVGCPRCGALRVVEEGRKGAQCPRCAHRIDLRVARRHFESKDVEEARAYMGAANRGAAHRRAGAIGSADPGTLAPVAASPGAARTQELRRIGRSLGAARGPSGRLRSILRKGFEAFGQLTPEDLDIVARAGELNETGQELAQAAVDQGLAARGPGGELVPLRDGR